MPPQEGNEPEKKQRLEEKLEKLWKALLKRSPTDNQLLDLIANIPIPALREKALKQLCAQGPTRDELIAALVSVEDPDIAERIEELLNARNKRDEEISKIIEKMRSLSGNT